MKEKLNLVLLKLLTLEYTKSLPRNDFSRYIGPLLCDNYTKKTISRFENVNIII